MSDSQNETHTLFVGATPLQCEQAFALVEEEILREPITANVGIEVFYAASTVVGAESGLHGMRSALDLEFKRFDFEGFDKLPVYARATLHAHTQYELAQQPPSAFEALVAEGDTLRAKIYDAVIYADKQDLVDARPIKELHGQTGRRGKNSELFRLVGFAEQERETLLRKTALDEPTIARAKLVANALFTELARRDQTPLAVGTTREVRQRALSLLVRQYNRARRAIMHVRADAEDVETFIPSLRAGIGPGKHEIEVTPPAPGPIAHAVSVQPEPAAANEIPPGMPGASPYMRG